MELNVPGAQGAARTIPVGQHDAERILAARLAVIAHIHLIGPTPTVDLGCALDMTGRRPGHRVCRHPGALDLQSGTMVDVGQMAPKPVLDPTRHTEGPFRTRWRRDPSSTGHEVPAWADGPAAGDICVRR